MRLRRGDEVIVLTGRDKGKKGNISRALPALDQVVVEGVNIVKRHTKPSDKNPRGGILEITKPLAVSKVAYICPSCKKPTRIAYVVKGENKERTCAKCKAVVK